MNFLEQTQENTENTASVEQYQLIKRLCSERPIICKQLPIIKEQLREDHKRDTILVTWKTGFLVRLDMAGYSSKHDVETQVTARTVIPQDILELPTVQRFFQAIPGIDQTYQIASATLHNEAVMKQTGFNSSINQIWRQVLEICRNFDAVQLFVEGDGIGFVCHDLKTAGQFAKELQKIFAQTKKSEDDGEELQSVNAGLHARIGIVELSEECPANITFHHNLPAVLHGAAFSAAAAAEKAAGADEFSGIAVSIQGDNNRVLLPLDASTASPSEVASYSANVTSAQSKIDEAQLSSQDVIHLLQFFGASANKSKEIDHIREVTVAYFIVQLDSEDQIGDLFAKLEKLQKE